uniref:lysozyme n=1 Tax=Oculatella sp. LEGE 06141 TaxID=1828648 RepID=UPI001D1392B7|nr:lysozyme [Oculatella sp. LEGE 06141]
MAYSLKFVLDTLLKQTTAQSSQLDDTQLQSIEAGTELPIVAIQPVDANHLKVTLGQDDQGNQLSFKGRNTWYIYNPDVQIWRDGQPIMSLATVSQTGTSAPVYVIKAIADTWLKQSTASASTLTETQRQLIKSGTVLTISSYSPVPNNHLRVSLGKNAQGQQLFFQGRNTWYAYRPDVQILRDGKVILAGSDPDLNAPVYVLKAIASTWLKQNTGQASALSNSQRQLLNANTVLPISSYALATNNHLRVALGKDQQGKQVFFNGLTTWYVYRPDVQILRDGKVLVIGSERRQINTQGLELLKSFEGLRLTAYRDAVGVWTIGYGTTTGVRPGMRITQSQAEALLRQDLLRFETAVNNLVKVPLTDNQFSALVSFTYNVGERALGTSTLLRLLNQGNYRGAANEFLRWNKAGGRVLAGLTRRRNAERTLFLR